jgi:hypothetical protein
MVSTTTVGYRLDVADDAVDLLRFDALVRRARSAALAGEPEGAATLLRTASGLWRGEPLVDVPSEMLHRETVPVLIERWLTAQELLIDLDLGLGRQQQVVPELLTLTNRYPLREALWGQLILALHRSGRSAEALAAYGRAHDRLLEALGVDPGPQLRRLRQQVLTNDPRLAVTTPMPTGLVRLDAVPSAGPGNRLPTADTAAEGTVRQLGSPDPTESHRFIGQPIKPLMAMESLWQSNSNLIKLLCMVDNTCDGDLIRVSQHDHCEIDAQRLVSRVGVRQTLRAERDGPDRWVLIYDWESTTWYPPRITGLRNCRLGRFAADCNAHILVAELLFERPLMAGETITMEYHVVNPSPIESNIADCYLRRQRLEVLDYALDIRFSPDMLPTGCRQLQSAAGTDHVSQNDIEISETGVVHLSSVRMRPGLAGIEWHWPATSLTI